MSFRKVKMGFDSFSIAYQYNRLSILENTVRSILLFVHDVYEDLELWYPKIRLEEAGFKTVVAGPEKHATYLGKHGYPCKADISYDAVTPSEFSGLVIPGGYAPDKIRRIPRALEIVRELDRAKKMIAFICHAGWVPISAKVVKGRRLTAFLAIRDDLENAGAIYEDKAVVIDGNFVTSRTPADLPAFAKGMLEVLG
jgi:deglycase